MALAEVPRSTGLVPADSFGNRLRLVRAECGYNAEQLAAICGVTDRAYYSWEQGASPRNMARVVNAICEATGYDRDWLMWGGALDATRSRCCVDTCWSEAQPLQFDFGLQINKGHPLGDAFDPVRRTLAS